jgi:hypothetical protein
MLNKQQGLDRSTPSRRRNEVLPVLHVGFHKSGSTTLQRALFERHPEIANLGEPREEPNAFEAMRGVWDSCHFKPKKRTPLDVEKSRRHWKQAMAEVPSGKVPLFSKESLTQCEYYEAAGDRRIAERLHSVVGPARIIIVVRHQIRLIESLYLFHAKGARYEPAEQWLRARSNGPMQIYSYHAMAQPFVEVFGRENVAIFMFEDLKTDAAELARRMCEFIGVDPERGAALMRGERRNARVSHRYLVYSRLRKALGMYVPLGRLVPDRVRNAFNAIITGGDEAKIELPAGWVKEMETYYRDDNRRLAKEWALPLEQYGYPL